MRVETPFRDFLAFWERAEDEPPDEQERLWEELYAARHRGLADYYAKWFGTDGLAAALPRYGAVADELEARYAALSIADRARDAARLFGVAEPERAIALVGQYRGDAWMDEFDGGPTAFFALEMLPATEWSDLISVHEFAHVAHWTARGGRWRDEIPGLLLIMEGVAIAATHRLVPGAPPEQHFQVKDFAAWREDCEAAWARTVEELLAGLDSGEDTLMKRFFWPDWGRPDRDVPERIGYLVAARLGEALAAEHGLSEVVRWDDERAFAEAHRALGALR